MEEYGSNNTLLRITRARTQQQGGKKHGSSQGGPIGPPFDITHTQYLSIFRYTANIL